MSFDNSAYASRGRFKRTKFTPSSVDESLFGELRKTREPDPIPEFEPPWVDTGKTKLKSPPKPLLFYCPTTSSPFSSRPSSSASSRPSSRCTSSRSSDRKYKPVKFSPTVVDNTLFGEKKKDQLHSLQTEKFFTSMAKKELSFDGEVCNSYRPQSSICSSRPQSSQTPVKAKPSPPPWR
ncbi:RBPJ-interacting and tubulin-associated protein 1-like [Actinia tenebrosa]|uniref:RBPJ-interacting and tubulin-associated protein 1 n=1 Tax=Actinia tenebrosa TaxID=6105 RepID=A0A6P8HJJ4_ACTTE|nr:RBPJ-interacting and tubulin-associated protein 1-like [Actinia tenebrosa]